jgi:hypothetical protein
METFSYGKFVQSRSPTCSSALATSRSRRLRVPPPISSRISAASGAERVRRRPRQKRVVLLGHIQKNPRAAEHWPANWIALVSARRPNLLGGAATYWPRASSALPSALLTLAKELLAQFEPAPGQVPEPFLTQQLPRSRHAHKPLLGRSVAASRPWRWWRASPQAAGRPPCDAHSG